MNTWGWCCYLSFVASLCVVGCAVLCIAFSIRFVLAKYKKEIVEKVMQNGFLLGVIIGAGVAVSNIFDPAIEAYICGYTTANICTCRQLKMF